MVRKNKNNGWRIFGVNLTESTINFFKLLIGYVSSFFNVI